MKALAEFNAMHLLAKNYERMNGITVRGDSDSEVIIINNVPDSLMELFKTKINALIVRECSIAYNELEKAAEQYVKAAMAEAIPATVIKK